MTSPHVQALKKGLELSTVPHPSTVPGQVLEHRADQRHQRVRLALRDMAGKRRAQCPFSAHDTTSFQSSASVWHGE